MSDSPITIKIVGIQALKSFISGMIRFARDPVKFYNRAGVIMLQDIMRHFQAEENPDGSRWAPLKYKRKRGSNARAKILQDTGRLKISIKSIATYKGAETGTNIIYARGHQEGRPEHNLPARTFIWLSGTAQERIMKQLEVSMQNI